MGQFFQRIASSETEKRRAWLPDTRPFRGASDPLRRFSAGYPLEIMNNMTLTPFARFLAAARFQPLDHVAVAGAVTDFYLAPLLGLGRFTEPPAAAGEDAPDPWAARLTMLERGAELFPELPLIFVVNPCSRLFPAMFWQIDNRDTYLQTTWQAIPTGRLDSLQTLAHLTIPDPFDCPLNLLALEEAHWFAEHISPELKERFGYCNGLIRFEGPFDSLALNVGTEWFLKMYTEPEFVHRAMELFTEASIVGAKALASVSGAPQWVILAEDMPGLLRREHFQEFVLPYHRRLFQTFPEAVRLLHNDANTTHLLDLLPACDMDVFHFGYEVPIELAKEKLGSRVALMGNLAPRQVLWQGDEATVEAESRRIIEAGKAGGGFVFSTGGEVNPGTDPARLNALVRYAQTYGRYE